MSKFMSSATVVRPVKKEHIVMDLENDNEDVQIDGRCMRLLDSFREVGNLYMRDNPLRSIRYEFDNGGYDKRVFKESVTNKRSREDQTSIRVLKKKVESKLHVVQASEEESVKAMVDTSHVPRKLQHNGGHVSKKEDSEDETCRSSLVEIQVKCEDDLIIPLSDSDIIAVGDCPFLDEENSPFVPPIDPKPIDGNDESDAKCNSWFRKEIMKVLKKPISETELKEVHNEVSVRRRLTRCRQLLDGREITYETEETRPSYLDMYPGLKRKYMESLREHDGHRAVTNLVSRLFSVTGAKLEQ